MARPLRYLDSALADLEHIFAYIDEQTASPDIARAFVITLRRKCAHLAELPGSMGTERPEFRRHIRSTPCEGYVILFRYAGAELQIVNVIHSSRDLRGYFAN